MLAITKSGNNYHYLHWIASELGPIVTNYGKVKKINEDIDEYDQKYYELFSEIRNIVNNEELIFTFSLDKDDLIISTSYIDGNNSDLNNWYQIQYKDDSLNNIMDYYHYPMSISSNQLLSIAIPKVIRKKIQDDIHLLKAHINNISTGIFSAENGARYWFHAGKLKNYLIWKIGKKKNDEILYINENQLESYFSITRSTKKIKINWQYGNQNGVNLICQYIEHIVNGHDKTRIPVEKIFMYTCNGKIQDIKNFEKKDSKNIILLNPLSVLETTEEKKINIYETLYLAETGNAFGYVDV